MRKEIVLAVICMLGLLPANAQTMHQAYLEYIGKYSEIAVEQQNLHKIPASITLAQGLVESAAGKGKLVSISNNHFGIKCSDWTGQKVYADDDKRNECFRKYNSARESFEDHSQFLITRPRYASLFGLDATDYKGWAHGLKAAGYATDERYAYKLIKLIEDYDLHKYVPGSKPDMKKADSESNRETYTWGKASVTTLKGHNLFRNNGVKCVFAEAGDTYAGIAHEFNLKENKILNYNDLNQSHELTPGTVVYLSAKRKKASAEYQTHQIKPSENMYRIAQKYGIKLQSLYDLNQMPYDQGAVVNKVMKLR